MLCTRASRWSRSRRLIRRSGLQLCGYGDNVGLGRLLKSVLSVEIKKGHARTNWSVRPLPSQLIEYAHADVEHLVRLGKTLLDKLDTIGRRAWAYELSSKFEDKALYDPTPETMADRLAKGGRLDRKDHAALQGANPLARNAGPRAQPAPALGRR